MKIEEIDDTLKVAIFYAAVGFVLGFLAASFL